jgi:hypothetical protein
MSLADLIPELDRRIAERLETSLAGFEAALRDHLDRSHAQAIAELGSLRPRGLALLTAEDLAPLGATAASAARSSAFEDLLAMARAVDSTGDQVELLCRVLEGARHFGSRAALLVASPQGAQGWAAVGFGEGVRPLALEMGWTGSWANFAEGRGAVVIDPADAAPIARHFGAAAPAQAIAVPFVLGGLVGGALYVDALEGVTLEVAAIQLLAALAAARLESGASRPSTPTLYQATERHAGGLGLWTATATAAAEAGAPAVEVPVADEPASAPAFEPLFAEPVAEPEAVVSPETHQETFEESSAFEAPAVEASAPGFETPAFEAPADEPPAYDPPAEEPEPFAAVEPEPPPFELPAEAPPVWSAEPVAEEFEDVPTDVHNLAAQVPAEAPDVPVEEDLWAPEPAVQSTAYANEPEVVAAFEAPANELEESPAVSELTAGFVVEPAAEAADAAYPDFLGSQEPVFEAEVVAEPEALEEAAVEVEPVFEPESYAPSAHIEPFEAEVLPEFEPLDEVAPLDEPPAFEIEPLPAIDAPPAVESWATVEPSVTAVEPPRMAAALEPGQSVDATVAISQSLLREYALGQQGQQAASVAATGPIDLPPVVASEDETVMLRRAPVVEPPPTSPEDDTNPTISRPSAQVAPPADLLRGGGGGGMVMPPTDLQGPGWAFRAGRQGAAAPAAGGAADPVLEEARRLARLLVSEIKLYNEEQVEEGRRNRDLYKRLKDDIEHSREVYNGRVDPRALDHDFFREALVRVLAGGDPNALGV